MHAAGLRSGQPLRYSFWTALAMRCQNPLWRSGCEGAVIRGFVPRPHWSEPASPTGALAHLAIRGFMPWPY